MVRKIYNFFSSVRLAIFLLLVLAVTSIIGTVIEQQQNPDAYLREYGELTYRVFKFLGFTDAYHSWWYVLLLLLLAVNLTVCSIRRLPKIWMVAKKPRKTLPEGYEKTLKVVHRITLLGNVEDIKNTVLHALKGIRYKSEVSGQTPEEVHIFADKNVFARFGVYIVHLGILIVLIGGFVTAIFGFRGYMNLMEGGSSSNLVGLFSGDKIIELPFYIKCNKFTIDFYPSGMPKAYISDLSVIENGKVVRRKEIVVNNPLTYKGIAFYQASYGRGETILQIAKGNKIETVGFAFGQPIKFGQNTYLKIDSINSEAIGVVFIQNGKEEKWKIKPFKFYEIPKTKTAFRVVGFKSAFYSGLQVAKDPGAWIVWVGSTVLVLGLIVVFFIPHRRVWTRIKRGKDGKAVLVIGGTTNKGTEGLVKELEEVLGVVKSSYCPNTPKEENNG